MNRQRIQTQSKRNHKSGMGSPTVLLFMIGVSTVGVSMLSLAMNIDRNGDRARDKIVSTSLAESGLQELYDKIRADMRTSGNYSYALQPKPMAVDGRSLGTYDAHVVGVNVSMNDYVSGSEHIRRTNFTFTIEGNGTTSARNISTRLRSTFSAVYEQYLQSVTTVTHSTSSADLITFPKAALAANGSVNIHTNNGLKTYSDNGTSAHIVANSGISWTPFSGSKSAINDPNLIDVQGQFIVPASGKAFTEGVGGLGNPNGSVNYRNPASLGTSLGNVLAKSIVGIGAPINFANPGTTNAWKANWQSVTTTTHSHQYGNSLNSNSVVPRVSDGLKILPAPAHISGNLDVAALDELVLMPTSSNPAENVIYVDGNVTNLGRLRNLGVKIVMTGAYTDSTTASYEVSATNSPLGSQSRVSSNAAMLSLYNYPDAITFNSDVDANVGLVYSTNGGIKVTGSGVDMTGLLIAGGQGNKGVIDVAPRDGSTFGLHFDPNAASPGDFDPASLNTIDTSYVPAGTWTEFTPNKLHGWNEIH